mmetsp:Transcript_24259/g.61738  ORF Transcript_24259/g.61738 Transcript_24259/m.61738 type:complete len:347 (+) Transcript_24259:41-1081(+)
MPMNLELSPLDDFDLSISNTWSINRSGSMVHRPTGLRIGHEGIQQEGKDPEVEHHPAIQILPQDVTVDYSGKGRLGGGAGGTVFKGVHMPSNSPLAIKLVNVGDRDRRAQMLSDVRTLMQAQGCANLIHLYSAYIGKEDSSKVCIVLEFMDYGSLGTLRSRVPAGTGVPEHHLACISKQTLNGLECLHKLGAIHRDIKPDNVLVNRQGEVKLTDFGLAKDVKESCDIAMTYVGTQLYMSPERVLGKGCAFSGDVWSLGMVVYELAKEFPFPRGATFPQLFEHVCSKPEPRLDPSEFSPALCDFAAGCLTRDEEARWGVHTLLESPFVSAVDVPSASRDFAAYLAET